jgi:hypothetical protein
MDLKELHPDLFMIFTALGNDVAGTDVALERIAALKADLVEMCCTAEKAVLDRHAVEQENVMLREALEVLRYYVNNPSAWDHFSQNVSNAIEHSVSVLGEEK